VKPARANSDANDLMPEPTLLGCLVTSRRNSFLAVLSAAVDMATAAATRPRDVTSVQAATPPEQRPRSRAPTRGRFRPFSDDIPQIHDVFSHLWTLTSSNHRPLASSSIEEIETGLSPEMRTDDYACLCHFTFPIPFPGCFVVKSCQGSTPDPIPTLARV
jgi:hypothetical protein